MTKLLRVALPLLIALGMAPPLIAAKPERYSSRNGVVTDNRTGLQWQAQIDNASYSHDAALGYCAVLGLDGGGWRLPALKELLSLADPTRSAPAIDTGVFPGAPSAWFWSASTRVFSEDSEGWAVFFFDATSNTQSLSSTFRVRCVR